MLWFAGKVYLCAMFEKREMKVDSPFHIKAGGCMGSRVFL